MRIQTKVIIRLLAITSTFLFGIYCPRLAAAALLFYATVAIVRRKIPPVDRKFILTILIITVILKSIIMISYYHFWLLPGNRDLIGPDGEGFSQRGWYISRVLSGNPDYGTPTKEFVFDRFYRVVDCYDRQLPPFNSRGNDLFTYLIGFIYFLFGYVPLFLKFINILVSAASSVVLYLLALEIYDRKIAKTAFFCLPFFLRYSFFP